jgi:hypothetical protein
VIALGAVTCAAVFEVAGCSFALRSPLLDLKILAKTPLALFGGTYKGATGGWR